MTNNEKRERIQLVLFETPLAVPSWDDLNEATQEEAVRHLAQLLSKVQYDEASRSQNWGGQDA